MPDSIPQPESSSLELAPGIALPSADVRFTHSRSSGPGGQNVNKVNTRAELRLSIDRLIEVGGLNPNAAERLRMIAGHRLTRNDEILIASDQHRSQGRNKTECLVRLRRMIIQAQVRPKRRRRTRPTRSSIRARLEAKRRRSRIKQTRRRPNSDAE